MATLVPYNFMLPLMQRLMAPSQPPAVQSTQEVAPDLSSYPSSDDAAFANKYGFNYGSPNERFTKGHEVRVLNSPAEGRSLGNILDAARDGSGGSHLAVSDSAPMGSAGDIATRAQLAANRIPLAALGYDPSHLAYDPQPVLHPNIAGAYGRGTDSMYANDQWDKNPSTAVHESIHRGISSLRDDPKLKNVFENIPSEESVVRYLMNTKAGNPELGQGNAGDEQIKTALASFHNPMWGNTFRTMVDKLNDAAAQKLMAQQPVMGPR